MAQQQADALALLAETALHHGIDPGAPGERYQVVVHVDAAVLADAEAPGQSVLEDGSRVPAGTSQRLACDASRVVMRHDADGRLLEVGARTRTIPPALRRALLHRDRGCRFPGADCLRPRPSHPALGAGRTDDAVQPRVVLSPPSPSGARGGLPGRAASRTASCSSGGPMARCCRTSRRLRRCPPTLQRSGRATRRTVCAGPADVDARLAGRTPGHGLRDRRPASAGAWRIAAGVIAV